MDNGSTLSCRVAASHQEIANPSTMLKTILVGLNGSPSCRAATATALSWAKQHGAHLIGVAVVDPAVPSSEFEPSERLSFDKQSHDRAASSEAHLQAESLLFEFEWSCLSAELTGTKVHEEGNPGQVLSRHSQEADLLFVGLSRRLSAPGMSPLSHTLDKVLSNAIHPVVCVPATVTPGEAILVAYDGSIQAARTLFAFSGLELFQEHPIHLLAIDEEPGQHAEAILLADKYLTARGYQTRTERIDVQSGGVAAMLMQRISAVKPRLVVCGVFGKSLMRPVLCGSVTKTLLNEVSVPIFLYH